MKKKTELIVALDTASLKEARRIVDELASIVNFFKIGSQLFTSFGPLAVEMVLKAKAKVFLDLKFHDIPNTVASAAVSALGLGVSMFNVHALGGKLMLLKLVETLNNEVSKSKQAKPIILGVTVLTSLDRQQLNGIGIMRSVKNEVGYLARLCKSCGLDGVVCSGGELELLRRVVGHDFVLVVPGVRPNDSRQDDQRRTVTPKEAVRLGADFIVVGRPIIAQDNRLQSATAILKEINQLNRK